MTTLAVPSEAVEPVSVVRVIAKAIHIGVLAWTAFCVIGFFNGMAAVGSSASAAQENPTATGLGIAFGSAFWAMTWFVPIAGGELFAMGISLTVPMSVTARTVRQEWIAAGAIALLPVLAIIGLYVRSLVTM